MVSGIGSGGLRIGGLATGMDTDEMIKKMLMGQQAKIDKVKQDKQRIVWKQELYKDIIKDIKDLQNAYFNVTSKENLNSNSNYSDYISKSSNELGVTATAGQGALEGTYTVEVIELAKGATLKTKDLGDGVNYDFKPLSSDEKITLTVGDGVKFEVSLSSTDTVRDIVNKFKNAEIKDGEGKVTDKLSNYVNISFSELTRGISISAKETGKDSKLAFEGTSNIFTNPVEAGQNAKFTVTPPSGEKSQIIEKVSNDFTIDGVNYSLKRKGETADITISKDVDKTFDRIKTFFDKYNALVDKINTKLTEKKEYSYKPLTDDQKKDMKEDEIKAWEEKAKKGILRNDDNLERMLSELRGTFFAPVEGSKLTFNRKDLGLDTSNLVSKAGQIEFTVGGEETLKKALRERPEDIMNLFNKSYIPKDGDSKETIDKNSGIFQRVNNILKNYVGMAGTTLNSAILTEYANKQEDFGISGTGGKNSLPDQVFRKDNVIKELNRKLKERENALYKQFASLEKVMNKYNSQSSWLAQQLGGGQ